MDYKLAAAWSLDRHDAPFNSLGGSILSEGHEIVKRYLRSAMGFATRGHRASVRLLMALTSTISILGYSGATLANRFDFDSTPGRLPKDIVPSHYTLAFDLDPARETFNGRVEIDLTVRRPVSEIVLQATELQAIRALLRSESGTVRELSVTPDAAMNLWRLRWQGSEPLAAGRWRLSITYQGQVEKRGQGLFVVEYRTNAGAESAQRMLATQLQPTHARAVFPSFDEPAFRATFDIAITAPAALEAVSNMPVAGQTALADDRRRTAFARTPSMPTYLVALAVGDFESLTDSFDSIPLRILTARGRSHEARYAMDATKQLLGYFRDYFGIAYMLPKLDQLAIPGVRVGAMEDWGAISYNETLLLYDPKRSAPRLQLMIFNIVAHEIAHQWFGNLVTAAWWDDIWLNEAFATWMAAKAQDHFNPAWGVRVRSRLFREDAFSLDARSGTRAVADPPAHETGIFEVFDDITYEKGGAILGMFEAQLGESVFRDGLRHYMAAHRYSNATADDLWFHLSQAAGRDINPLVSDWIRQRGFPLLIVTTACSDGRTKITLSQERFSSRGAGDLATMWQVPVVIHGGADAKRLVLGREPQHVDFPGCVPVVANGDDSGYYRVQYDTGNSARLRAAYSRLPATERIGLVADTMALARSGRIEFADYFLLLDVMRNEREGALWQQVIEHLLYLDDAFAGSAVQASVRDYGRSLLRPVLKRLGWQVRAEDDAGTVRLRNALIDTLGQFDDAATATHSRAMFDAFTTNPSVPIEPSIRPAVIRTAARTADAATFETLRRLLREASNQEDNYLYGEAMTLVRDPALVQRILELTLTDEWPPGSSSWYARTVGASSGHPTIARDFILRHFDAVIAKSSRSGRIWLLPMAYSGFNQEREAEDLLAVQRRLLGDDAMAPAGQIAESIREKAALRTREEGSLPRLLKSLTGQRQATSRKPLAVAD